MNPSRLMPPPPGPVDVVSTPCGPSAFKHRARSSPRLHVGSTTERNTSFEKISMSASQVANIFPFWWNPSMVVVAFLQIQTTNRWLEDAHSKLFFPSYARQYIWLQSSARTRERHLKSRSCVRRPPRLKYR